MTVMGTRDAAEGLHNFREFSQPPECLYEALSIQKKYSIAFIKYFSIIRANLKRHHDVNILSSNTPIDQ